MAEQPFIFLNDRTIIIWSSQDTYAEMQQPVREYRFDPEHSVLDLKAHPTDDRGYTLGWTNPTQEIFLPRLDRTKFKTASSYRENDWCDASYLEKTRGRILLGCALSWNKLDGDHWGSGSGVTAEGTLGIPKKPSSSRIDPTLLLRGYIPLDPMTPDASIQVERSFPYAGWEMHDFAQLARSTAVHGGRVFRLGLQQPLRPMQDWQIMVKDCNEARQKWNGFDGPRGLGALRAERVLEEEHPVSGTPQVVRRS